MAAVTPDYQKFVPLLVRVFIFYLPALYAQSTTCDIKSVRAGEAVSLTCQFSERLDIMKTDVSIVHFNNTSQTVLAECFWMNDQPNCLVENLKGYIFNSAVANRLTVDISNPRLKHEGLYKCRFNGGQESAYTPCFFHLLPDQEQLHLEVVIPVTVACVILTLAVAAFAILWRQRSKSLCCQQQRADPFDLRETKIDSGSVAVEPLSPKV